MQLQPFNQETFQLFLSEVAAVLEDSSHHFVMDNVHFHKTTMVKDCFEGVNHKQNVYLRILPS